MDPPAFYGASEGDLDAVAGMLRAGECVALPTETVYGLAADALNESAVRKIFGIKGRPLIDPLIVHVANWVILESLAFVNPGAQTLAQHFWPGALTLILSKRPHVPALVTAGRSTVAVRMPSHPLFVEVMRRSGLALAAPSANPFGYISPTRASHVRDSLGARVPHILDGGACAIGLESTIIDCTREDRPRILRAGPISRVDLEQALGRAVTAAPSTAAKGALPAPGMLSRHYSPRTPLKLIAPGSQRNPPIAADEAMLHFQKPASGHTPGNNHFWLTESGDPAAAAHNLFHLLRTLDKMGWKGITMETAPAGGIGDALNDRLRRAAAK